MQIAYQSTSEPLGGVVERQVSPWFVRLPRVQGWCHLRRGERVFRVDRMRSVAAGDAPYVPPPDDAESRI